MSQENVEVVRRANEAFDARDMDALLAEHHPEVEIVVLRSEIEGPYRGHEGLRRMTADNFEANVEVRIDEIRDCGDRVLLLGHQHATVRGARWDHVLAGEGARVGPIERSLPFTASSEIFPAHGERLSVSVYRCSGPEEARERSDAAYSVAASRARAAAFM
jgi:hypothetical protein